MKLAHVVAKTDRFPLRPLYGAIYRQGIRSLVKLVKREEGLLGIYLTGSYLSGEHTHGVSDVDLFFIVRGDSRRTKFEIKRHLTRCATFYPFLGPVDERVSKVVFLDSEDGRLNNPDLDYLWEVGLLEPIWEAPEFRFQPTTPRPARALSELQKLLHFILLRVRENNDPLSFWRSRTRAVQRLAEYLGAPLELPPQVEALVREPGYLVSFREDEALAELCLKSLTTALCDLKEALACQTTLDREIEVENHGASTRSIPGAPPHVQVISEITRESLKEGCGPVVVELPGFKVLLCYSVSLWHSLYSCVVCDLESPWTFHPGSGAYRVNGELWDWQVDNAREKRESQARQLKKRDYWILGNDQRILTALLDARQFDAIAPDRMDLFWTRQSVIQSLRREYPEQSKFLDEFQSRCNELHHIEVQREAGEWERDAELVGEPNFYGHLVDFARALSGGETPPPIENLGKRLSLSLCLITRDRAEWLEALLHTVCRQTRAPDEVVIVDNSPTRSARPITEKFQAQLRLIYDFCPDVSLGELRNRAVSLSTGSIICFTDDDCLLHPNWLAHVERNFLRDEYIGAMGGRVDHLSEHPGALEEFHRLYLGDSKW